MKITLDQLAKHHGITLSSVKKWSKTKRAAKIADMRAGVLPHITDLIGELAGACYRASCYTGKNVKFDTFCDKDAHYSRFSVFTFDDKYNLIEIVTNEQLSTVMLCGAIAAVEELCK